MGRLSGLQRGADAIVDAYNKQQAILQKEADYQRAKADMESERNRQRQERKDDEETQFQQVKMGLKKYMETRESPNAPSQGPPELVSPSGGYQQESESAERIPFGVPGWATQAPAQPKGQMQGPPELIQPTTAQAPLNSAEMRQSAMSGLSGVNNADQLSGYKMGMDMFGKEDPNIQVEGKQDYTMAKSFFDLAKPHVGNNPKLLRVLAEIAGINVPDDVWDSWQSPQKTEKPALAQKATPANKQRDYVLEAELSDNRKEIIKLKKELRELDDSISGMDAEDDYDEIQRINDIKESRTKEIIALEKKNKELKELSKKTTTAEEPESETDKYLKSIGLK